MGASVHELDLGIVDIPIEIGADPGQPVRPRRGGDRRRAGRSCCRSSSARRGSASRSAPSPTIRRRRCRSASACRRCGGSSGASPASSRSSPGCLWGSRQGVQFALTLVVLKALPVLIIGGFTSIGGAIVGGLIVGASDSLAEIYLGPLLGGSVSTWFAYALARRLPADPSGRPVRRSGHRKGLTHVANSSAASLPTLPQRARAVVRAVERIGLASCGAARARRSACVPADRQRLLAERDPHPVPDHVARRPRAQPADGLHRAGFARHRRLHVGRRLCHLQSAAAPPRTAAARQPRPRRSRSPAASALVCRPAQPAHQGLLSARHDACGAVLPRVAVQPVRLVLELPHVELDLRAASGDPRPRPLGPDRSLSPDAGRPSRS